MANTNTHPPATAAQKVFDTNELLELILINVDSPAAIVRLSSLSKSTNTLVHFESGQQLKAKTFSHPIKDASEKWVVNRDTEDPLVLAVPISHQMPLRTRSIVQNPVILNPAILRDKHYGRRDLYARMELQTECVTIVPDIRTLLKNLNGFKRDGKMCRSTIYNMMLCKRPAKRVSIDWEGKRFGTGAGVHRLHDDQGITLKQVVKAYGELKDKGLKVVDIRIPGVFFVTEREWDWVHGRYKFPGPSSETPRTRLEDLPFAVDPHDRDGEKQECDALIAKIASFLPSSHTHDSVQLRGLRAIKKGLWARMKTRKFLTGAALANKRSGVTGRRSNDDNDSDDSSSDWTDVEDDDDSVDSISDREDEDDWDYGISDWADGEYEEYEEYEAFRVRQHIERAQIRQMREVMSYRRMMQGRDANLEEAEKGWIPLPDGTARSYLRPRELVMMEY